MKMTNNYAVLIGVHDYRQYDPTGRSDVPGALSDARAWVAQCLLMGFSPEHILVATAPALSQDELGPEASQVKTGDATREGILAGLTWLMKKLSEGDAVGLLTFSGHGIESDGRLLLCPSDTTSSLDNVIDMLALNRTLGGTRAAENLTLVIDGCHAQAGLTREESINARLTAHLEGVAVPEGVGAAARVLSACRKDQESVSSRFLGKPMGAFTWAVISALGQWKMAREGSVLRSTVSYGELVSRSRSLLSALSFTQEPVLSGVEGVAKQAFLHPGDSAHPGSTSPTPNGLTHGRQLDAGSLDWRLYNISYQSQFSEDMILFAQVIVTNGAGSATIRIGSQTYTVELQANQEYWIMDWGTGIESTNQMEVVIAEDGLYSNTVDVLLLISNGTFQANAIGDWASGTLPAGSCAFVNAAQSAEWANGLSFSTSGSQVTSVAWCRETNSSYQLYQGARPGSGEVFFGTPSPPSGYVASSVFSPWSPGF